MMKLPLQWKPLGILLACLFFGWISVASAEGSPADQIVEYQVQQLPTEPVEQFWDKLVKEYGGYFPENRVPSFMELLTNKNGGFQLSAMAKGMLRYFLYEIIHNGKLLASIVILTVFSMLLETLQSAFEKSTVSKVAFAICYLVLMVLAINSFSVAIGYARSAIEGMMDFMVALIPLLLALIASMGNVVSVSILHPLVIFMIHTVGTFIYIFVFPLLFFSAVLHIVSSLTDKYKVTQLANLLRNLSVGLLGIIVTVFLGVLSIQGATSSVADGVTIRTAKYVTGNFVPVVGRLFSDASDTVIGASLLVKNAVGISGVVIIILLCAFPALKILTLALVYNLSSAVMQPMGDSPIIACLQTIGKCMIYVFAALAVVGLMFFLAIVIIITAANISVMMR
jgi:stage III sporulation protein AE